MKSKFNQFAAIESVHKNDDGTLVVHGYASSAGVDSDGEIITSDAMASAIPDYMKFGAVREMHGKSAAGTALEIEVQDDGRTAFSAHIVDPIAVKKVETGVYKGFSIGGNVLSRDKADKSTITGLRLIEVSLVDRPANPEALITMYKADEANKTEAVIEPVAEVQPVGETVQKGIFTLADFATSLAGLQYLVASTQWEAEAEGDGSPVPAQLRAWLNDGFNIFKDMAAEELAEAMACLTPPEPVVEVMEMSSSAEVKKAGSKFSKATAQQLGDIHKAVMTAHEGLQGLGYDLNADDDENDDSNGADEKAASINQDDDANVLTKSDYISKVEEIQKALDAANDLIKSKDAEIVKLKAEPAPPKAALNHAGSISKAEDVAQVVQIAPANPHKPGTVEYAEFVMKSTLKNRFTAAQ